MELEKVQVTPELAKAWLEKNKMNRTLRPTWVEFLSSEMKAGNWKINGDTFAFDSDGYLTDGQHRLNAVIDSGYSYEAVVVRDLDPRSRLTMDAGNKRRFADDLTMAGEKNAVITETMLRKVLTWNSRDGLAGKSMPLSRSTLAKEWPVHHKAIAHAIHESARYWRAPCGIGQRQFMYWLLCHYASEDTVRQYFSILAIGSQIEEDKVLVRLRNKLSDIREADAEASRKTRPLEEVYHMIRGWNAWVSGETLRSFNLPSGWPSNPFPKPVKVIER